MELLGRATATFTRHKITFSWLLTVCFCTMTIAVPEVNTSSPPHDIYWNRTNQIFHSSNNDHIFQVTRGDRLKFVCPYYPGLTDESAVEYYTIYRVPKSHYESCTLPPEEDRTAIRVINCTSPSNTSIFISVISPFSGLPGSFGGLTYKDGRTYYFISVSSGPLSGINHRESAGSSCKNDNMKVIVRVCCGNNSNTHSSTGLIITDHTQVKTRQQTSSMTTRQRITTPSTQSRLTTTKSTVHSRGTTIQPFPTHPRQPSTKGMISTATPRSLGHWYLLVAVIVAGLSESIT